MPSPNPDELIRFEDITSFMNMEMSDEEFYIQELDHDGTFDNLRELKDFYRSIFDVHLEGISFEYYYQKLNSYRTTKFFNGLVEKGLIEETEDEEGNIGYTATALGVEVFNQLK